MFHAGNNVFFGRLANGDVRVLRFSSTPATWPAVNRYYSKEDGCNTEIVLPSGVWASVVASVSLQGEGSERFYAAQAFHMNPQPSLAQVVKGSAWPLQQKRTNEQLDNEIERSAAQLGIKAAPSHKDDKCLFDRCPYPASCVTRSDKCMHHRPDFPCGRSSTLKRRRSDKED